MPKNILSGNKGEWSEIYIFFKLLNDRKIYAADKNMNKLQDVFLNIIRIIREEETGKEYSYYTGDNVLIKLNGKKILSVDCKGVNELVNKLWQMISNARGTFSNAEITEFLNSIYITKLKSPAQKQSCYFGGTQDITVETEDFRSGIRQIMGFSCKSDLTAASTLFNASGNNTNFIYKLIGSVDDSFMQKFNSLLDSKGHTDVFNRIKLLKENNIDLLFIRPMTYVANQNLVMACGTETPSIVGAMLYFYFYVNNGKNTYISDCLPWICAENPVKYSFDNLNTIYRYRIQTLLYTMFTGLRFSKPWNCKNEVNGGYIAVKTDGDIVAYHSCIADEFKEFLFEKLRFETPSCSRHQCMSIEKKDGEYFLKLPLQIRFSLKNKII